MFLNKIFKATHYSLRLTFFHLNRWIHRGGAAIYTRLKFEEIGFFSLFLFHRYSPKQFNPKYVFENLRMLVRASKREGLTATREGELIVLKSKKERLLFFIKNSLLGGALQKRVEKAIIFTYLTVTLELNNPFDQKILIQFLDKKIALLERLLDYVKTINGKVWDQTEIRLHIEIFRRNSLLQADVIRKMKKAVQKQKEPQIVRDAKAAMQKGLYPILATKGLSGSYWMRGVNRDILGLFKPFDEEIHAPNNPVGPRTQGSLGLRKTRWGCRVGESAHHEVGAFIVDEFFGFGIVPRTYYAEFEHQTFFLAREDRLSNRRAVKKKWGSFQEYVGGFVPASQLSRSEIESIPLDEFQLLVVLDVIIGNTDRHMGNILFGDEKIAAIDHGLSFTDEIEIFKFSYWTYFEQGKYPLFKPIVDLLNHFPLDALANRLKKKCAISLVAINRMRERVALMAEAAHAGLAPSQLSELFTPQYLRPLKELEVTLKEKAQEQLRLFCEANNLST